LEEELKRDKKQLKKNGHTKAIFKTREPRVVWAKGISASGGENEKKRQVGKKRRPSKTETSIRNSLKGLRKKTKQMWKDDEKKGQKKKAILGVPEQTLTLKRWKGERQGGKPNHDVRKKRGLGRKAGQGVLVEACFWGIA